MNYIFLYIYDHMLLCTHSLDPCLWGETDLPACGPPASSVVTPAGSVHKFRGDNVVHVCAVEEMMSVVYVSVTDGE